MFRPLKVKGGTTNFFALIFGQFSLRTKPHIEIEMVCNIIPVFQVALPFPRIDYLKNTDFSEEKNRNAFLLNQTVHLQFLDIMTGV